MLTRTKIFAVVLSALVLVTDRPRSQQVEAPTVFALEPNSAVTTPGERIRISGTRFSPDSVVYFAGIEARETIFVNSGTLEVVTPYLRPGKYELDLKSGGVLTRSSASFDAIPAPVDSSIERADALATKGDVRSAIAVLTRVGAADADYDVRAFSHYRAGQLYLAEGDCWAAAEQAALIWDSKVSMGVQTSWRFRLLYNQMSYVLSESTDMDTDLKAAESSVAMDVTENPEPRFWRALISARFGKIARAKEDLKFLLAAAPGNPSYQALAAYVGVLAGDKVHPEAFSSHQFEDPRTLALLGQAEYLIGEQNSAQTWWAAQAKTGLTQARLDCLAGRKHLNYGQTRVGAALLTECITVLPGSTEAKKAKDLLAARTSVAH